jgi:hypothetical protein
MRIAATALLAMATWTSARAGSAQIPPEPPPPGAPVIGSSPPAPPPNVFAAQGADDLAGYRGGFFLRDRGDRFRLFPRLLLEADAGFSLGPGVDELAAQKGGADLRGRLVLRRAKVGFEGDVERRIGFSLQVELGGQPLSNPLGDRQNAASKAGSSPSPVSAAWAPVQTPAPGASLADVWINLSACPCFNLMVGQFQVPLGIENRTEDGATPWMERNLAIRGLAAPNARDIGAMAWGQFGDRTIQYELGLFGGDGQNRPTVDDEIDFTGRVFTRPFIGRGELGRHAQVGVSARVGLRDPSAVGYDRPAITSAHGFALWRPAYLDLQGRTIHVLPSGAQTAVGGELRGRLGRFDVQGEAYFVSDDTREAVEGFQFTNTERLGRLRGVAWYAQLSAWPLGEAFSRPEPGIMDPRSLGPARPFHVRPGLEVLAIVSGVNATYAGASRRGTPQASVASAIEIYEVGVGAQVWLTQHARVALNYLVYVTPGSGGGGNAAQVPASLSSDRATARSGHLLHELGARASLSF